MSPRSIVLFRSAAIACLALAGCEGAVVETFNRAPVVQGISASPTPVFVDTSPVLHAAAFDEDGDQMAFAWSSEAGEFEGGATGAFVRWTAPSEPGDYEVHVRANDGVAVTTATARIRVLSDEIAGPVTVQSSPAGAHIYFDGRNTFFATPHMFSPATTRLSAGPHVVSVSLPGRILFPDTLLATLPAGKSFTISFTFLTTNLVVPARSWTVQSVQITSSGMRVVWSDDSAGSFTLFTGDVSTPGVAAAIPVNTFGYSGAFYNPTWKGTARLVFQNTLDDTGSRLFDVASGGGPVTELDLRGDARQADLIESGTRMVFVRHLARNAGSFVTQLVEATDDDAAYDDPSIEVLQSYASVTGRVRLSTPSYSSDGTLVAYSRALSTGAVDLIVYDLVLGVERQIARGDRAWPTFGRENVLFFHRLDAQGDLLGVFGALLDRSRWALGRSMRVAHDVSGFPSYGLTASGVARIVYLTPEGVRVSRGLDD